MTMRANLAGRAVRAVLFTFVFALMGVFIAAAPAAAQTLDIRGALASAIANTSSQSLKKRLKDIDAYYAKNFYKPIWVTNGRANAKAEQMVETLNLSYEDGLDPEDYDAVELFTKLGATSAAGLTDLEVHLSTATVSYAQHMHSGRLDPRSVNKELVIYPSDISADTILTNVRKTKNIKAYMRLLAPHTQRYERLRQGLAVFRRIEARGGWTVIPEGGTIKPGGSDMRIPKIRRRMQEAATFNGSGSGIIYDPKLVAAVKQFQEQVGITPDGVIGPGTIKQMNVSVAQRIKTMELNMERNRWLQNDFPPTHVFVNLADQVVKLVRNGDTQVAEVVQVGQPYHRTPVFTDNMEYIEFNPFWNVPPSIAVNEYLPQLRKNPNALSGKNIAVMSSSGKISPTSVNWSSYSKGNFPFSLRQDPGPDNALGRVKFMFPNQFNIYMHDTPAKSKFDATQRYFSHGCIRLKDPLTMAEAILGPEGWSRDKINAVIKSGKNTVVNLKKPIPVYIVYLTTFVNKDGTIWFREDVYGRDKILADALAKVRGH